MTSINVSQRTQMIVVDVASRSVSIINAGPVGPAGPTGEVSLAQMDSALALKVAKAGDTMTGALTIPVTPTAVGHATSKQYVDTAISNAVTAVAASVTTEAGTRASADSALDARLDAIEGLGPLATAAALTAHIDDDSAAHAASAISLTPVGDVAATTVQAAIAELATEKQTAAQVSTAITAAINALLDGAPGALDTLNELAAALADDASFAASVTTALAGKQPLDSDLTAIAALSTTAWGRALLALADAPALRTAAGVDGVVHRGALVDMLDDGRSVTIGAVGDSTGNGVTDWLRRMFHRPDGWRSLYPGHTFRHHLWADALQGYDPATVDQVGAGGAANMVLTGGSVASTACVPTGVLTIRAYFPQGLQPTGTPGLYHDIINAFGGSGNRGWRVYVTETVGGVGFERSRDGSTLEAHVSYAVTPTLLTAACYLEWSFDPTTAVATIRRSVDGSTWTTLTTGTAGSPGAYFPSTAPLQLGARMATFGGAPSGSQIGWVEVIDGGRVVASWSAALHGLGETAVTDYVGRTWTTYSAAATVGVLPVTGAPEVMVANGCHPGAVASYADNATRWPKLVPRSPDVAIINFGHNQSSEPDVWCAEIDSLARRIHGLNPRAQIAVAIQNPQRSDASNPLRHERRCAALRLHARRRGYVPIDGHRAFVASGDWLDLMADSVHPTETGFDLWAAEGVRALRYGDASGPRPFLPTPTTARPSAVLSGPGATVWDSTISKPIWSDGAVWRDATGTAV